MAEHVVSVFPVNVAPTDDDPRTVGWRFACTCMRRRSRNYLISVERADAERWASGHLNLVGQAAGSGRTGDERPVPRLLVDNPPRHH